VLRNLSEAESNQYCLTAPSVQQSKVSQPLKVLSFLLVAGLTSRVPENISQLVGIIYSWSYLELSANCCILLTGSQT